MDLEEIIERLKMIHNIEQFGPEKFTPTLAELFINNLIDDFYPRQFYEKVFGVEMKQQYTPLDVSELWIGKLTYGAWQTLKKNGYITKESVTDALWNQDLPKFFEKRVRQLYVDYEKGKTKPGSPNMYMTYYVPELIKRGFKSISWDSEVHQLLSKKIVSTEGFPSQLVPGIRVEGDQITPEKIQMDSSFEECPIAVAAGIPLFVKKLPEPGKKIGDRRCYIICRMMSQPSTGVASPRWAYGGQLNPAPPVLLARKDAIAFTEKDWYELDDFEMQMLNDGPRQVTREDFVDFANGRSSSANVILEVKFPRGLQVRIVGLQRNIALNDKSGEITGKYENGRVGVKVDDQEGVVAVRPANLTLL